MTGAGGDGDPRRGPSAGDARIGPGDRGDVGAPLGGSIGAAPTGGDAGAPLGLSAGAFATGRPAAADVPSDDHVRRIAAGTLLADRYEVKALLGSGGMGAVYHARDRARETDIALKVMLPSLLAREKAVERFRHEAELMLRLSHEGIVRVFDVGEDRARGLRFYTMERLQGMSLRGWLEAKKLAREPVGTGEALEIVRQLLEALRYAHKYTVHRDLKPENVFLTVDPAAPPGAPPRVRILDFGIAKLQSAEQFTSTSMALGTAYYMAPEQQTDAARVDPRADLYSVSVILYELLTGELPVGRFQSPSAERRSLPKAVDDLVLRGLEPRPERRFETADRLLVEVAAIRALVERGGGSGAGRPGPLLLGALLCGAALVAGVVFLGREPPAPPPASPAPPPAAPRRPVPVPVPEPVPAPAPSSAPGALPAPAPALPPSPPPAAAAPADIEPPTVHVASPAPGLCTRETTIDVRGRVEDAHPAAVLVGRRRLEIGPDGGFRSTVTLGEGRNHVVVLGFDRAGNTSEPVDLEIERDTVPPGIALAPLPPTSESERIRVSGEVDEDGCRVVMGDAPVERDGRRFEAGVPLALGDNAIRVVVTDRAGNEAVQKREVRRIDPALGAIESVNERWGIVIVRLAPKGRAEVGERLDVLRGDRPIGRIVVVKLIEPEPGAATGSASATPDGVALRDLREGDEVRRAKGE